MSPDRPLLFIPTYNESENVVKILDEVLAQDLGLDVLFLDDNSPDGTGAILDGLAAKQPAVSVIHRGGKEGIGTAHKAGIRWAYERGYSTLITMDCDFSHQPKYLGDFLRNATECAVVVGSRHLEPEGLEDWDLPRYCLTKISHFVTEHVLGLPYDATNAYRLYNLTLIPPGIFDLVQSKSYSFFFESLFILHVNAMSIKEIPVNILMRTRGQTKMTISDVWRSVRTVLVLGANWWREPRRFLLPKQASLKFPARSNDI